MLEKTITEKSTKLTLQLLVVVPNAQTEFQEIDPISATPNVLGHLRKLGTKTHLAKLTHILPLKKLGDVVIRGYFCCPPLPQAVLSVLNENLNT